MNWELLLNYINGDCDATGIQKVQEWSEAQTENRFLLNYLQKRKAQLSQPLKQTDIDDQWLRLLNRIFESADDTRRPGFPRLYWLTGIAASLLLMSLLGWHYFAKPVEQIQTIQTAANVRNHVTLPDGSQVYMAPNSKLSFNAAVFNVNKRELHLSGEAFFDVEHKVGNPFIIITDNKLSISVLGTSFNVYARPHTQTEVKVASGLVGISANKHINFLKAGHQLVFNADDQQLNISAVKPREAASLQNDALFFDDDNAGEIAEKLRRWYNIKVQLQPAAKRCRHFSGEVKDTGIADVLQALSYATGLHYRFKNTNTLILF